MSLFLKYREGKSKQLFNKVDKCYSSPEVFLFHKSNTCESSCEFNCLPLFHLKMLS